MSNETRQEAALATALLNVASLVRTYFEALVAQGFTDDQALELAAEMQTAMMLNRERGGAA